MPYDEDLVGQTREFLINFRQYKMFSDHFKSHNSVSLLSIKCPDPCNKQSCNIGLELKPPLFLQLGEEFINCLFSSPLGNRQGNGGVKYCALTFSVMATVEIWLQFFMALACLGSGPFLTWTHLLALEDHQCPCSKPHSRWQLDASPCGCTLLAKDKNSSAQKTYSFP